MKKLIFPLLSIILTCQVHAGVVLKQKMETPAGTNDCTIYVQGHLMRTDIDANTSSIADTKTGEVLTIMHQTKQVMRIKGKVETPPADAAANLPKPEFKDTGEVETINGYECRIVTADMNGVKLTYWVAKNFPDYEKIQDSMTTLGQANTSGGEKQEVPEALKGMIIKTSTVSPQYVAVTTLESVKTEDIKPEVFAVPAGYTVIDINQ